MLEAVPPFANHQDAPCLGDRDPLITRLIIIIIIIIKE